MNLLAESKLVSDTQLCCHLPVITHPDLAVIAVRKAVGANFQVYAPMLTYIVIHHGTDSQVIAQIVVAPPCIFSSKSAVLQVVSAPCIIKADTTNQINVPRIIICLAETSCQVQQQVDVRGDVFVVICKI